MFDGSLLRESTGGDTTELSGLRAVSHQNTIAAEVLLSVICRGVLCELGFEGGIPTQAFTNPEAILALLIDLKTGGGTLYTSVGKPISVATCLGLLARLGVETPHLISDAQVIEAFSRLGLIPVKPAKLLSRVGVYLAGKRGHITRCIDILEERGYRLRLSGRLTAVCQPVPEPDHHYTHFFYKQYAAAA